MNTTLQKKIIAVYTDKKNWHPPSYQFVADKLGTTKSYVHKVVHSYPQEEGCIENESNQ